MLVTYRQPMGYRRPLRVGWARYTRLLAEHHLSRGAAAVRSVAVPVGAVLSRARPNPMADGTLLVTALLTGLGALAVAALLGFALADWAATAPDDGPAAIGAFIVGTAFLGLCYLVFASRRGRARGGVEHAES